MAMEPNYWDQYQTVEDPLGPPRTITPPGTPGSNPGPFPPGDTQGPPVTTTPGTTPAPTGDQRAAFRDAWLAYAQQKPANVTYVDWLKQFVAQNPQYGATLGGSKGDKVYGPGGVYWADAVISSGINGGTGAAWNEDTGGGGAPGGMGGTGFGDYTAPFTERYSLPSLEDLQHMPGYQAGLDEYRKGIETSAASKGTLLTGGTLQRLGRAGTDYANQAYGQLAGLQANEFNTNYGIFRNNQNDPFNKYYSLAQLGRP